MQNNMRSIMQINCNFIFSIILESLYSFKSSNLLEANRLTNAQVSKNGDWPYKQYVRELNLKIIIKFL